MSRTRPDPQVIHIKDVDEVNPRGSPTTRKGRASAKPMEEVACLMRKLMTGLSRVVRAEWGGGCVAYQRLSCERGCGRSCVGMTAKTTRRHASRDETNRRGHAPAWPKPGAASAHCYAVANYVVLYASSPLARR